MAERTVTEQDLISLIEKFKTYTETAEQHEFTTLVILEILIEKTNVSNIVKNQKAARAMYRSIARAIGVDYSDFVDGGANE